MPAGAMPGPAAEDDTQDNMISDESEEETLDLRNYFPETWLWELRHSKYVKTLHHHTLYFVID